MRAFFEKNTPTFQIVTEKARGFLNPVWDAFLRRPKTTWVLILFFLLLVAGASFQAVVNTLIHSRPEVAVPDLVGQSVDQALDTLSSVRLPLAKDSVEFNESYPPGAILRQSPPAGLKVREGKVMHVTLSSGGQVVFVPELAGKLLPEAQNLLRLSNLSPGAVGQTYSTRFDAGWVMEQNPAAGTVAGRGQMVDMKVSKGAPPEGTLLMPDFANKTLSDVKAWAQTAKLNYETKDEIRSDMLPGLVVAQAPPPDTLVTSSVQLAFTVSRSTATLAEAQVVRYRLPSGSGRVQVRITVRDERDEREIYKGSAEAGSTVEAPVMLRGLSRARIFVNGVLVEERVVE